MHPKIARISNQLVVTDSHHLAISNLIIIDHIVLLSIKAYLRVFKTMAGCRPSVGWMLAHCRKRWPGRNPALGPYLQFTVVQFCQCQHLGREVIIKSTFTCCRRSFPQRGGGVNRLPAKVSYLIFRSQMSENYSYLFNLRPIIRKSWWAHFLIQIKVI